MPLDYRHNWDAFKAANPNVKWTGRFNHGGCARQLLSTRVGCWNEDNCVFWLGGGAIRDALQLDHSRAVNFGGAWMLINAPYNVHDWAKRYDALLPNLLPEGISWRVGDTTQSFHSPGACVPIFIGKTEAVNALDLNWAGLDVDSTMGGATKSYWDEAGIAAHIKTWGVATKRGKCGSHKGRVSKPARHRKGEIINYDANQIAAQEIVRDWAQARRERKDDAEVQGLRLYQKTPGTRATLHIACVDNDGELLWWRGTRGRQVLHTFTEPRARSLTTAALKHIYANADMYEARHGFEMRLRVKPSMLTLDMSVPAQARRWVKQLAHQLTMDGGKFAGLRLVQQRGGAWSVIDWWWLFANIDDQRAMLEHASFSILIDYAGFAYRNALLDSSVRKRAERPPRTFKRRNEVLQYIGNHAAEFENEFGITLVDKSDEARRWLAGEWVEPPHMGEAELDGWSAYHRLNGNVPRLRDG